MQPGVCGEIPHDRVGASLGLVFVVQWEGPIHHKITRWLWAVQPSDADADPFPDQPATVATAGTDHAGIAPLNPRTPHAALSITPSPCFLRCLCFTGQRFLFSDGTDELIHTYEGVFVCVCVCISVGVFQQTWYQTKRGIHSPTAQKKEGNNWGVYTPIYIFSLYEIKKNQSRLSYTNTDIHGSMDHTHRTRIQSTFGISKWEQTESVFFFFSL